jgi:hypothetical protein
VNRRNHAPGLGALAAGAAACAGCCAGPILGFLAAAGLVTSAGFAMFGALGVLVAVPAGLVFADRRRRRLASAVPDGPVPVTLGTTK